MEHRQDGLWQGGPWEQPSPVFPAPPRVEIPQPPYAHVKGPRRRTRRRWIAFSVTLALICSLTAASILLGGALPQWEQHEASPKPDLTSQTVHTSTSLPRAETGSGVTVNISPLSEQTLSYNQVYEKNEQSIVTIYVLDQSGSGQGTGIVLTQDGYIITNAHVLQDAQEAVVVLNNDMSYEAKLVGISEKEDLAVVKIDTDGLVPAEFGDSSLLRVGDQVSALGNPLGYRMTLTPGIISAMDRALEVEGNTMYLLQTSAAINFGNSGGALLNDRGQVIGVTTVKIISQDGSAEALGFAIPTQRVKYVVDQLIAGEEIKTPVLGISVEDDPKVPGLTVKSMEDWSDAKAQGMQVGDVIVAVNGSPVRVFRDLQRVRDLQKVGDSLLLSVERGGETLEFTIRLEDETAHLIDN